MLSFLDAVSFSFNKRTFILAPVVLILLLVFAAILYIGMVAFGFTQNFIAAYVPMLNQLPMTGIMVYYGVAMGVILQVMFISLAYSYLFVKAKREVYDQSISVRFALIFKVFLVVFCAFVVSGVSIGFWDIAANVLTSTKPSLYRWVYWSGVAAIVYLLICFLITYCMTFSFFDFGRKFIANFPRIDLVLQCVIYSVLFVGVPTFLVVCGTWFWGEDMVQFVFTAFCVLALLCTTAGRVSLLGLLALGLVLHNFGLGFIQLPKFLSIILNAYMIFCLNTVMLYAFFAHLVAQSACVTSRRLYPRQFKADLVPPKEIY